MAKKKSKPARESNRVSFYELMQFYPDADLLPFEFNKQTELVDVEDEVRKCGDSLFMLLAFELCDRANDPVDLGEALKRLGSMHRQLETVTTAVRDKFLRRVEQRDEAYYKRNKKKK